MNHPFTFDTITSKLGLLFASSYLFSTGPTFLSFIPLFLPSFGFIVSYKKWLHFISTIFWRNYLYPSEFLSLASYLRKHQNTANVLRGKPVGCLMQVPFSTGTLCTKYLKTTVLGSKLSQRSAQGPRAPPGPNMLYEPMRMSNFCRFLFPPLVATDPGQVQSLAFVQNW